jgi:hypothetical protein
MDNPPPPASPASELEQDPPEKQQLKSEVEYAKEERLAAMVGRLFSHVFPKRRRAYAPVPKTLITDQEKSYCLPS